MSYPRLPDASLASDTRASKPTLSTVSPDRQSLRATPLTRKYEIAGLTPSGHRIDTTVTAPATPDFETAFASYARGTLIPTEYGPTAVEDLEPGMEIETVDNGLQKLLWIGSMQVFPDMPGLNNDDSRLIRISADTFGIGRPMPDLMLGPRARMLFKHQGCTTMFGTPSAFAPARAFVDGVNLIDIRPVTPVRTYHLAFHGQQTLRANGVETESFHPGESADQMMDRASWDVFMGLFPHVRNMTDFGPMPLPRITAFEFEGMRAA